MLTISASQLGAQSEEDQSNSPKNSLQDGSWSLQFQVNSNFTLSSFQGTIFSLKRHFSEHDAVRVGLSLSVFTADNDQSGSLIRADTLYSGQTGDRSEDSQGAMINAQYLYYPNPLASINFFFGGGPIYQSNSYHTEDNLGTQFASDGSLRTTTSISDNDSWGVGARALAGAEWFAMRSLSLHAEYGLSAVYVSTTSTSTSHSHYEYASTPIYDDVINSKSTQKGWQFNGSSVKFGLSIYF